MHLRKGFFPASLLACAKFRSLRDEEMALLIAGGITAAAIAVAGSYGFYRMMRGGREEEVDLQVDQTKAQGADTSTKETTETKLKDKAEVGDAIEDLGSSQHQNIEAESKSEPSQPPVSDDKPETENKNITSSERPRKKQPPPVVSPKPSSTKNKNTTTKDVPPPVSPKPLGTTAHQRKPMSPLSPNAVPVLPVAFGAQIKLRRNENAMVSHETENRLETNKITGGEEVPITFEEPAKAPTLRSPSRNKGPSNRRPPTRH